MTAAPTTRQPNKPRLIAPYKPLPWQVVPFRDKSPVVLCTGGAGGGKSKLAGEKTHAFALKYPGATCLILRKAKTSMSGGTILFMRRKVVGNDPNVRWIDSPKFRFEYRNGSIVQFVGLFDEEARENLKSIGQDGAVDFSWLEEGSQFEEEDINAVLARMRGKAAPWTQTFITTNPDSPLHWIYRRLIVGKEASVYQSFARDNPYNPATYETDTLGRLTGVDYDRLVRGEWTQAAGQVFDTWTEQGNVTEAAEYIPDGGSVVWFIDDGYSAGSAPKTAGLDPSTGAYVADSHPRVILWVQMRHDGRLCIFNEDYACLKLSDVHLGEALQQPYPFPEYAVHGPGSAEIRGRLQAEGILPRQSTANVKESIKELRTALAPDVNGWRRVLVHPRCHHLRQEMLAYAYKPGQDEPMKAFDHGPDALRSGVWKTRNDQ